MQLYRIIRSIAALCVLGALSAPTLAAPITTPSSLNPGDEYRIVFVTTTKRDAFNDNDINVYNAFVAAAANAVPELAALATTWSVVGSTEAVDARDNTGTNPTTDTGVPIFLLNDTKVADNNAEFWGGLIAVPINIHETGVLATDPDSRVFTGTQSNGTERSPHALGNCCNTRATAGSFNSAGAFAIDNNSVPNKGESHFFYGMSGILTVEAPVPAPPPLAGLAAVLVGFAFKASRAPGVLTPNAETAAQRHTSVGAAGRGSVCGVAQAASVAGTSVAGSFGGSSG